VACAHNREIARMGETDLIRLRSFAKARQSGERCAARCGSTVARAGPDPSQSAPCSNQSDQILHGSPLEVCRPGVRELVVREC
jgi:hypothetical protein